MEGLWRLSLRIVPIKDEKKMFVAAFKKYHKPVKLLEERKFEQMRGETDDIGRRRNSSARGAG
jgi:hypothetical protein